MIRVSVSALAGAALALLLFWLLALLVSPPEPEVEAQEMPVPLARIEAPRAEPEAAPPPAEALPPAPPTAVAPPPMPEPAPIAESRMALPKPELPQEKIARLELDTTLPALSEARPKPQPEPAPEPEPEPQPAPEPRPAAVSSAKGAQPAESSRETASPSPASSEPVDVGQVAPTERVPPDYPARAQRRGLEGYVEVVFVIRPDGRVDPASLRVLSARPRNVFDAAARQAVARWRFEPSSGLRRARQRLEFQLR